MSEHDDLSPVHRELEAALRSLPPAAARIDPVAAAFAAGQRTGRRHLRVWQAAAALLLMVGSASWLVPLRSGNVDGGRLIAPTAVATNVDPSPAGPMAEHSWAALQAALRDNRWDNGNLETGAKRPEIQPVRVGDRL